MKKNKLFQFAALTKKQLASCGAPSNDASFFLVSFC